MGNHRCAPGPRVRDVVIQAFAVDKACLFLKEYTWDSVFVFFPLFTLKHFFQTWEEFHLPADLWEETALGAYLTSPVCGDLKQHSISSTLDHEKGKENLQVPFPLLLGEEVGLILLSRH